jgi:hypothetical protein
MSDHTAEVGFWISHDVLFIILYFCLKISLEYMGFFFWCMLCLTLYANGSLETRSKAFSEELIKLTRHLHGKANAQTENNVTDKSHWILCNTDVQLNHIKKFWEEHLL